MSRPRGRPRQPDSGAHQELREFLQVVGDAIGGEPGVITPSGPARAPQPAARSASGPRIRARYVAACCVVVALAIAVAIFPYMRPKVGDLPALLQGRWRTNEASFAGRELVLTSQSITFSAGKAVSPQTYAIVDYKSERAAGENAYRIDYLTDEGPFTIRLRVEGNELRLLSRSEVAWFRVSPEISQAP